MSHRPFSSQASSPPLTSPYTRAPQVSSSHRLKPLRGRRPTRPHVLPPEVLREDVFDEDVRREQRGVGGGRLSTTHEGPVRPEVHDSLDDVELFGNLRELIRPGLHVVPRAIHASLDGYHVEVVDSGGERANGARLGVFRDQLGPVLPDKGVADVLRDYLGLGERQAVGGDEKRHLALRVHGEVLLGLECRQPRRGL